jgi:MFS family permease
MNFIKSRIATATLFFYLGIIFATWASRIPDIQEELTLNVGQLGFVLLGMPTGSLISVLFTGWLIDRFGSKTISLISAIIACTALVGLALAPSMFTLGLMLVCFGASDNMLNIAANTQAVGLELAYTRTLMSSFHGIFSVGAMFGALFGGFFIDFDITPLQHFYSIAIVLILFLPLIAQYLLPKDIKSDEKQPLFALPDKPLLMLGLIAFCCMLAEGAMADWSGIYYKQVLNGQIGTATHGYTAFAFVMAICRLMGDWFIAKIGVVRSIQISGITIAIGLSVALLFPVAWVVILGFGLVGAGVATVVPLVYSLSGKSKTMSSGAAIAAASTVGYTGFLIGPPAIGFVAEASSLRWALCIVVGLGLLLSLLASKVREEE